MDPANSKALSILDEALKETPPPGPVTLDDDYLRAIDLVESWPQNQSGTDKTWVVEVMRRWREVLRSVERLS